MARRWLRVGLVALVAVLVAALDAPSVVAAPSPTDPGADQAAAAEPAPKSEPRDLAKELGGGSNPVDVGGQPAHFGPMLVRDPAVDLGHHPVPVEQQVEGDDRHHHHEDHEVDDRHGRTDQGVGADAVPF